MELSVIALAHRIQTEADAYLFMEELRWPDGPVCPHCGHDGRCYFLNPANGTSRKTRTGSATQRRVWKCGACRKQFSVITDTLFHGTKIPLRKWLFVLFEMVANKNGVAAREIERRYDLTPKSAWFMLHRIRAAMEKGPLAEMMSGTITADETYIGGSDRNKKKNQRLQRITPTDGPVRIVPGEREKKFKRGPQGDKTIVLSLVNQDTGEVRSRVIPNVTGKTLTKAIAEQCDLSNTTLHTDEAQGYHWVAYDTAGHKTVNHAQDEYVRYEDGVAITTNHAEGFFSQLKRSLDGTHHHISKEHLHRYLAEFDFRYSTRKVSDSARMTRVVGQIGGRRLTYKHTKGL